MGKRREIPLTRGSGHACDPGFPNPAEGLAEAKLAYTIGQAIAERGLTQRETAVLMGVDQPKVSHVLHGRLHVVPA